jgi:DNA-binding GntR family transcriptional regulator
MPADEGQLVDAIVEVLEKAIQSGEIVPGRRVSELALSSTLRVSRGPLREAIRKLEARRLFERTAFHGIRLVDLSIDDLEQLLVVREMLEGAAARAAAAHISAKELADLRAYTETGARRNSAISLVPLPADGFHHIIARASKNRWLEEMLCKDLYGLLRAYRFSSVDLPHRAKDAHQEHQEIVEALAQRDGDKAERLMRKHNRNGRINLIRRLRAEGVEREDVSLRSILRTKRSPSKKRVKSK